jgi:hypothetical protein
MMTILNRLSGFSKKSRNSFPTKLILLLIILKKGNNPDIPPVMIGRRKIKKRILNFSPFIITSNLLSSF